MEKQSLELLLEQGESVERIAKRFGKDPSTVSYWMKKHGLTSPYAERHAARGGIERERLEALVGAGMTIAEIASEVQRSKGTVRHWLREYGLKTSNSRGSRRGPSVQAAKEAGKPVATMRCARHGVTEFVLEARGYYRCKRCRAERVARRRRDVKAIVVREAGGRCQLCGYDRCVSALHFHHIDPEDKRFHIALRGAARSLERVRREVQKCVLLCANCHAEVESGVTALPLQYP
jgi:transposase-like protein